MLRSTFFKSNNHGVVFGGIGTSYASGAVAGGVPEEAIGDVSGISAQIRLQTKLSEVLDNPKKASDALVTRLKAIKAALGAEYKAAMDDLKKVEMTNTEAHALALQRVKAKQLQLMLEIEAEYGVAALDNINAGMAKVAEMPMGEVAAAAAAAL
jgi:hypothetical protein